MFEAFSNANLNVGAVQVHSLFVLVFSCIMFSLITKASKVSFLTFLLLIFLLLAGACSTTCHWNLLKMFLLDWLVGGRCVCIASKFPVSTFLHLIFLLLAGAGNWNLQNQLENALMWFIRQLTGNLQFIYFFVLNSFVYVFFFLNNSS
jgi:hypothetical protein